MAWAPVYKFRGLNSLLKKINTIIGKLGIPNTSIEDLEQDIIGRLSDMNFERDNDKKRICPLSYKKDEFDITIDVEFSLTTSEIGKGRKKKEGREISFSNNPIKCFSIKNSKGCYKAMSFGGEISFVSSTSEEHTLGNIPIFNEVYYDTIIGIVKEMLDTDDPKMAVDFFKTIVSDIFGHAHRANLNEFCIAAKSYEAVKKLAKDKRKMAVIKEIAYLIYGYDISEDEFTYSRQTKNGVRYCGSLAEILNINDDGTFHIKTPYRYDPTAGFSIGLDENSKLATFRTDECYNELTIKKDPLTICIKKSGFEYVIDRKENTYHIDCQNSDDGHLSLKTSYIDDDYTIELSEIYWEHQYEDIKDLFSELFAKFFEIRNDLQDYFTFSTKITAQDAEVIWNAALSSKKIQLAMIHAILNVLDTPKDFNEMMASSHILHELFQMLGVSSKVANWSLIEYYNTLYELGEVFGAINIKEAPLFGVSDKVGAQIIANGGKLTSLSINDGYTHQKNELAPSSPTPINWEIGLAYDNGIPELTLRYITILEDCTNNPINYNTIHIVKKDGTWDVTHEITYKTNAPKAHWQFDKAPTEVISSESFNSFVQLIEGIIEKLSLGKAYSYPLWSIFEKMVSLLPEDFKKELFGDSLERAYAKPNDPEEASPTLRLGQLN